MKKDLPMKKILFIVVVVALVAAFGISAFMVGDYLLEGKQQENRYEGYTLTGEDIYTLACFVWAEARDEAPIVQQAVAEVVLNRVISEKYPQTVEEVIKQTEFYRSAGAMARLDEPEQDQYIAVDAAMYGPYILPEDICFYSQWETGKGEWGSLGRFNFYETR